VALDRLGDPRKLVVFVLPIDRRPAIVA